MRFWTVAKTLAPALILTACFGTVSEPARHYYTLHLEPLHTLSSLRVPGLIRVRDMDAESAYDRFQIVIRRSPFELTYREREVWAVKPQRMISDLIARGLLDQDVFSGVTRELSERRPDYVLSGELHALEIYDSDDLWFAHISLSLQITHVESGKILWTYNFDERKQVPPQGVSHAVRALSELLSHAVEKSLESMQQMQVPGNGAMRDVGTPDPTAVPVDPNAPVTPAPVVVPALPQGGAKRPSTEPIIIPETRRE